LWYAPLRSLGFPGGAGLIHPKEVPVKPKKTVKREVPKVAKKLADLKPSSEDSNKVRGGMLISDPTGSIIL
jgi:hypothetical protein